MLNQLENCIYNPALVLIDQIQDRLPVLAGLVTTNNRFESFLKFEQSAEIEEPNGNSRELYSEPLITNRSSADTNILFIFVSKLSICKAFKNQ